MHGVITWYDLRFVADHQEASQAMSDRERKVKAVYSETVETGLTLLGAIAVEDKLQGGIQLNKFDLNLSLKSGLSFNFGRRFPTPRKSFKL